MKRSYITIAHDTGKDTDSAITVHRRLRLYFFLLFFTLTLTALTYAANNKRTTINLENDRVKAVFDLGGGALADFHFKNQRLNPLAWRLPEPGDLKPQMMGHFICFDRLGGSSKSERSQGMPNHGEASKVMWHESESGTGSNPDGTFVQMWCELPLARMRVDRTAVLSSTGPVMSVEESFTNMYHLGKLCNIVQHPSIGGDFLDDTVIVDSNAWKGYANGNPKPMYEEPAIYWPYLVKDDRLTDLRKLVDGDSGGVENFVCKKDVITGWMTACNPGKGLLIGYVWDTADYPWIRHWRHIEDGKPLARGLEFGTTPLPFSFGDILEKGSIFDTPIIVFLDSQESITKSYTVFLLTIPSDFTGVDTIEMNENSITVTERETGRNFTVRY